MEDVFLNMEENWERKSRVERETRKCEEEKPRPFSSSHQRFPLFVNGDSPETATSSQILQTIPTCSRPRACKITREITEFVPVSPKGGKLYVHKSFASMEKKMLVWRVQFKKIKNKKALGVQKKINVLFVRDGAYVRTVAEIIVDYKWIFLFTYV